MCAPGTGATDDWELPYVGGGNSSSVPSASVQFSAWVLGVEMQDLVFVPQDFPTELPPMLSMGL